MNVIVCVDDNSGMLFNGRRQSKDIKVLQDIEKLTKHIWMSPFSETLFRETSIQMKVDEMFLEKAEKNDFCFVENKEILPYVEKIEQIIIYKWNRKYPSDFYFQVPLNEWSLIEQCQFSGNSHENITREIYVRSNER